MSGNRPHGETRTERNWREVHERLVAASVSEVAENGLDGATIRSITTRANVATGTFYNHFADLEQVLDELAESLLILLANSTDLVAKGEDPAFVLGVAAGRVTGFASSDKDLAITYSCMISAGRVQVPDRSVVQAVLDHQRSIGANPPRELLVANVLAAVVAASLREIGTSKGVPCEVETDYYAHLFASVMCFTPEQIATTQRVARAELETIVAEKS